MIEAARFLTRSWTASVRGATAWTLVLQISKLGLGIGLTFLISRSLGAQVLGVYSLTLSWLMLLLVPAVAGWSRLLVREIASFVERQDLGSLKGLMTHAGRATMGLSVATTLASVVVVYAIAPRFGFNPLPLVVTFATLPLFAALRVFEGSLLGMRRVVEGQLPELVVQPLGTMLLVAAVVTALALGAGDPFGIPLDGALWPVVARSGAIAAALAAGFWLARRRLPKGLWQAEARYDRKVWNKSALLMTGIASLSVVQRQADITMLGALTTTREVGLYSVAVRAASLVALALFATNKAVSPEFSRLFAKRDSRRLQRLLTRSTRLLTIVSVAAALPLLVGAPMLLGVFGAEFVEAAPALRILVAGQIVNAAAGPVGIVLAMTGNEQAAARNVAISTVCNVSLNFLLIPRYGLLGAAVATAVGIVLVNILQAVDVWRRLGLRAGPFARIPEVA